MGIIFNHCFAQYPAGSVKEIEYKGNKFVLGPQTIKDTIIITDPITGNDVTRVSDIPIPVSMNDRHIYSNEEVDAHTPYSMPNLNLEEKILNNLKDLLFLSALPDGILHLRLAQVVTDENGKIVYDDFAGINLLQKDNIIRTIGITNQDSLFSNIVMAPVATHKGNKVISRQNLFLNNYLIQIKNHKLIYSKK